MRHGLYAKRLSKDELRALRGLPIQDLEGEIAYQRALLARLAHILENNGLAAGSTAALQDSTRHTVRLLNETTRVLLSSIRTHPIENEDEAEYVRQMEAGKQAARKQRNVFDYLKTTGAKPARRADPDAASK